MEQHEKNQKNSMEYLTTAKVRNDGTVKVNNKDYLVSQTVSGQKMQIFTDGQGLAAGHTGSQPNFRLQEQ